MRESPWAVIAIVVIVSCLITSGVCKVLKMNMKTVRRGAAADEYVTGEGLALTESSDRFMYTTETRTKIKSDSSDGGGGGSTADCAPQALSGTPDVPRGCGDADGAAGT